MQVLVFDITKHGIKKTGIPIEWIEAAGHNSNTDAPEKVNELIERFILNNFEQWIQNY